MLYARMLYWGFASYECEPWPFLPWCTRRLKPCTFCVVGQIPPTKLSLYFFALFDRNMTQICYRCFGESPILGTCDLTTTSCLVRFNSHSGKGSSSSYSSHKEFFVRWTEFPSTNCVTQTLEQSSCERQMLKKTTWTTKKTTPPNDNMFPEKKLFQ